MTRSEALIARINAEKDDDLPPCTLDEFLNMAATLPWDMAALSEESLRLLLRDVRGHAENLLKQRSI